MPTSKKIYLHIGLHKTATTSIQSIFLNHSSLLLDHGIYYSTINENHSIFLYSMFCSNPEEWFINKRAGYATKQRVNKLNKKYLKTLEAELTNPKIKEIIFSGEALSLFTKEELDKFSTWLRRYTSDITVIAAVRNPIDWYTSRLQQDIKGRVLDINEALSEISEQKRLKYRNIEKFIDCFGIDNIKVFSFDKHKHYLYQHLSRLLNINDIVINKMLEEPIARQNESLCYESCLLLDSINTQRPWDYSAGLTNMEPAYLKRIIGQKFKLPKHSLQICLEKTKEDIEWISNTFADECGNFMNCFKDAELQTIPESLFEQKTIDSLAILLSDLIYENTQLKGLVKLSPKSFRYCFEKIARRLMPQSIMNLLKRP